MLSFGINAVYSQGSDSLKIDYNYINSLPQNAQIYVDDEFFGSTPLFFQWKDTTFPKQLKITMKGYADYFDNIPNRRQFTKTYSLIALKGTGKVDLVYEDSRLYFNKPRKVFPIVISGLFAAVGGIAAYYFRNLASENRKEFEITHDPALLDQKNQYDIYSGLSVMVFQTGLFFLTYFLFMD